MGFFDSFKSGAKDVFKGYDKVKLKEKITYDELYEIMKTKHILSANLRLRVRD